jgi:hypothetical protein
MPKTRKKSPAVPPPARSGGSLREVWGRLESAVAAGDGLAGALALHEAWMRGEIGAQIEQGMARLWPAAAPTVPDWLPMRHVPWLPHVYDVTARFQPTGRGRSNIYLVLLDYGDTDGDPFGLYVGMSRYPPAQRFEQHKAGIRAAGSVLRRGLEVLTGPTLHLQGIPRTEAVRIEEQLAEALRASGLRVQGGH